MKTSMKRIVENNGYWTWPTRGGYMLLGINMEKPVAIFKTQRECFDHALTLPAIKVKK